MSSNPTEHEGLKLAVIEYLKASAVMEDFAARGIDDSGKRETPSYRDWCAADCRYQEALENVKRLVAWESE